MEKEIELIKKFENDKKSALDKVYAEKLELEKKMEKIIQTLNDRYDALGLRYKLLENKKKESYARDNFQTMQRLATELADRNKTIDSLHKEVGKLKLQIKYADSTLKIFSTEKTMTVTHKKNISDGTQYGRRPSSVSGSKTFKF